MKKFTITLPVLTAFWLLLWSGLMGTRTMAADALQLRMGFPAYAFAGLDANDSETVATFYMKKVAEDLGLKYSARIYPKREDLYRDMSAGKLDMVLLSGSDICYKEAPKNFPPILAPIRGDELGESLQLYVHRDSGIKKLADLRGRHLLSYVSSDAVLEKAWLDRELAKNNLAPSSELFRNISHPEAASKTVLPVFFRKADACLISKSLFDIMGQLNPQLRQRLVPLAKSENLLSSVLCLRADYPEEGRRVLIEAASNLTSTPHGKQLMILTKLNRIIPFKPEMLRSVEELLKSHQNLVENDAPSSATASEPASASEPMPPQAGAPAASKSGTSSSSMPSASEPDPPVDLDKIPGATRTPSPYPATSNTSTSTSTTTSTTNTPTSTIPTSTDSKPPMENTPDSAGND